MSDMPWPPYTGRNFGFINPDRPPALVGACKGHAHKTDSFVLTLDNGRSQENYRCDTCRILWAEPLPPGE